MTITTINASEDHNHYIGQVYQEHYAKLRHYFLIQLGSISEADDCVQATIRYFFFFMEDRCWETDVEYIPVYLMRIAGSLCSRRLAKKSVQRSNNLDGSKNNSLFNKIKNEVIQTINGLVQFRQLFLRAVESNTVRERF
jgi:DNA-directed RNA polymerase specialized sigma24 family protein